MRRAALTAVALALVLGLAIPASALAHAQLEETTPERGAVVKHEPEAVIFRFDEPVEGNFGAVRVYDASGNRVDEGDAFHPDGEGPRLGVHLKPGLPDGSYTGTYRVISADGHIVSSGFVFSIGKAGKAPAETVAELTAGSGSGPVTETAFGIARGLQYAAIALGVGGLAFLMLAWLPALGAVGGSGESWRRASLAFASRLRVVLLIAAGTGALSAAAGVVLEGAEAAGISGFSALKESIIRETLETKFGTIWGLAVLAWIAFAVLAVLVLRPAQARGGAAGCGPDYRGAAGLRRPRSGPLGPRQHAIAGCPQLSGQRRPRRRDRRLAGRPRCASVRRPARDQRARSRRPQPAPRRRALALLGGGADRRRGDPSLPA